MINKANVEIIKKLYAEYKQHELNVKGDKTVETLETKMTYRKTGTRDPSGTLARPYKNRKTRTREPTKYR